MLKGVLYHKLTFRRYALIELRADGSGLFDDLDSPRPTRVVCSLQDVVALPRLSQ